MKHEKFAITDQHLKLLNRMWFSWETCEFGAPCVDPKRPYGNSEVFVDIAEIIGLPMPDRENDKEFTLAEIKLMDAIHREMETVLQIGVRVGYFKAGYYEFTDCNQDWKPCPGGPS